MLGLIEYLEWVDKKLYAKNMIKYLNKYYPAYSNSINNNDKDLRNFWDSFFYDSLVEEYFETPSILVTPLRLKKNRASKL